MPLDNTNSNSGANAEITALKNQVFVLLVALVVVTGSLVGCLYRQDSLLGKQNGQMTAMVNNTEYTINSFVGKLADYAQRHPEFVPLLKKYNITVPPPGAPKK